MQCDLGAPCQRCVDSGTNCSGPTSARVFVHLNVTIIHKRSHRDNLHAALATKARQARHRVDESEQGLDSNECLGAATVLPIWTGKSDYLVNTVSIRMLYTSVANEFNPSMKVGIFSGDRSRQGGSYYSSIAICIRGLLPHVSRSNKILDLSLFTLLTRYFGAFREDQNLVNLARSSYTSVLSQFHRHITSMDRMFHSLSDVDYIGRALLCLCSALLLFEVSQRTWTTRRPRMTLP